MGLQAAYKEEDGIIILQTGYNMLLTSFLNKLPKSQCEFRGETKCWYIHISLKDMVLSFLKRLNYEITDINSNIPSGNDPYSILGLTSNAVWEVCESAYRTLAKINHPDNGGNNELMQKINSAWSDIKIMRGK